MAAVSVTVKLVEPPAATVVVPKFEAVKPAGTVIGGVSVNAALPMFCTVMVFTTAVPAGVEPKATLPVPSGTSTPTTLTAISGAVAGAVTVPLTVKSNGLAAGSLVTNDKVPL